MIRAKYRCNSVEFWGDPADENTSRTYTFQAVYDTSTPENQRFTKSTPWGELKMRVDNPEARFETGKYYYLDFTAVPVEPTEPTAWQGPTAAEPAEVTA